jgi:hypothetical protein
MEHKLETPFLYDTIGTNVENGKASPPTVLVNVPNFFLISLPHSRTQCFIHRQTNE